MISYKISSDDLAQKSLDYNEKDGFYAISAGDWQGGTSLMFNQKEMMNLQGLLNYLFNNEQTMSDLSGKNFKNETDPEGTNPIHEGLKQYLDEIDDKYQIPYQERGIAYPPTTKGQLDNVRERAMEFAIDYNDTVTIKELLENAEKIYQFLIK